LVFAKLDYHLYFSSIDTRTENMTEFNTELPGVRQVQGYIKDKQEVELKLVTDDLVVGKILWQDADSLCMVDHYSQETLVWRQALVYIKPKA
jgi:host factor-I protein